MTSFEQRIFESPALYRLVILLMVAVSVSGGFWFGTAYHRLNKEPNPKQPRIEVGTMVFTGDYEDLIQMGVESEFFHLGTAREILDGPQFVFKIKEGKVKGWLDNRPGVVFETPPIFDLDFKPKDPNHPTVEEIQQISRDIVIELSQYIIVLPDGYKGSP